LERSLIAERVRAGLRRARAEGKRLGRPRVHIEPQELEAVIRQRLPVRTAAKALGISPSSYARLLQAHRSQNGIAAAVA
jgi:DNA invertase Pin-like site-specific DNA recombinase